MAEKKTKEKQPEVSFVICTYNGERILDECLGYLVKQDYPKDKIEVLIADGGSKDKTVEIAKKYQKKFPKMIGVYHNKAQYDDGKGAGKDTFSRKSKGKIVCFIDQDNLLVQKDWITNMLKIFEDKKVDAAQSRLIVPEKGSVMDKYLNAVGIEDPFAINYSLIAQVTLNPHKFKYDKKGKYHVYGVNKNNFCYGGANGFMMRREEFLECGGYTQDIDMCARMAKSGKKYTIAVPDDIRLHHKTSADFWHFLEKRGYYVRRYLIENYGERDFYWFSLSKNNFWQNFKFIRTVLFNLSIILPFFQGLKLAIRDKKMFWLAHPFFLFAITLNYIYSFIYSKFVKKAGSANI